jgi:hypothetical protein
MSFCPSKDIHSVYLDNELPEIYKAEYESHIASCPKCKAELEWLRGLRGLLTSDSASITPDEHFLDESYQRLMIKMSYAKNTGIKAERKINFRTITYAASGIAAAAILALVLPVRAGKVPAGAAASVASAQISALGQNASTATSFTPAANNVSFNSGNEMVISGNINESVLSSHAHGGRNAQAQIQNVSANANPGKIMKGVEVLRPDFDENETITIKITLPGMNSVPVTAEIQLPAEVMSGRF